MSKNPAKNFSQRKMFYLTLLFFFILLFLAGLFDLKISFAETLKFSQNLENENGEIQSDLGALELSQSFSTSTDFLLTHIQIYGNKDTSWYYPDDFFMNFYDSNNNFVVSSTNTINVSALSFYPATSTLDFYFDNLLITAGSTSTISIFLKPYAYPPNLSRIDFRIQDTNPISGCLSRSDTGLFSCGYESGVSDLTFKVYGDLAVVNDSALIFPTATTTIDFPFWEIYSNVVDFNKVYTSRVYYSKVGGSITWIDYFSGSTQQNYNPLFFNISKTHLLSNGNWYAYSVLSEYGTSTILASSSVVSFNIGVIGFPTSTLISTSTIFQITCDSNDAWYYYSLCYLARSLLSPDVDLVNDISGQSAALLTKAPMGYFALAREKIDAITLISTSTPALTLSLDLTGAGKKDYKVLDFVSTENLAGSSAMTLFFNLIQYGFWLGFVVYLILRISHLDL